MHYIIDVSNLLHRSFHIYRKMVEEGQSVNFYEFVIHSMKKTIPEGVEYIYAVWDIKKSDKKSFRYEILGEDYKAGRDKSYEEEMMAFADGLQEFFTAMGIKNMYPQSLEADDIMAYLSINLEGKKVLFTEDTDMLQMISEDTSIYMPRKKQMVDMFNFSEIVGMDKKYFILYKAIKGDTADNIKGLQGFGEKKSLILAKAILDDKKDIEKIPNFDIVKRNLKAMSLAYSMKVNKEECAWFSEQLSDIPTADMEQFELLCEKYKAYRIQEKSWEMCSLIKHN